MLPAGGCAGATEERDLEVNLRITNELARCKVGGAGLGDPPDQGGRLV